MQPQAAHRGCHRGGGLRGVPPRSWPPSSSRQRTRGHAQPPRAEPRRAAKNGTEPMKSASRRDRHARPTRPAPSPAHRGLRAAPLWPGGTGGAGGLVARAAQVSLTVRDHLGCGAEVISAHGETGQGAIGRQPPARAQFLGQLDAGPVLGDGVVDVSRAYSVEPVANWYMARADDTPASSAAARPRCAVSSDSSSRSRSSSTQGTPQLGRVLVAQSAERCLRQCWRPRPRCPSASAAEPAHGTRRRGSCGRCATPWNLPHRLAGSRAWAVSFASAMSPALSSA